VASRSRVVFVFISTRSTSSCLPSTVSFALA
jgi:hypothetical protein